MVFGTVLLHFYLRIFTFIQRILRFIQCLYAFFKKRQKSFYEVQCFFLKGFHFIFHEKFLPVNMKLLLMTKITLDVNNYLFLILAVQEMQSSLHIRCSFWCLIMASKLKLHVYARSLFCHY